MPKILNIITVPNPLLKHKSLTLEKKAIKSSEIKTLMDDMAITMIKKDGVGLAAPQIGKNIRLAVINSKDGYLFLFNPKITKKSWSKEWGEEGCLSVPGVFGMVKRHKKITCIYLNEEGREIKIEVSGFMARVFQHEIDHLDGILFTQKAKKIKKVN